MLVRIKDFELCIDGYKNFVHKNYALKLESYNTDRKTKNVLRHIFALIIISSFAFAREKKILKFASEYFASIDANLRTALKRGSRSFVISLER